MPQQGDPIFASRRSIVPPSSSYPHPPYPGAPVTHAQSGHVTAAQVNDDVYAESDDLAAVAPSSYSTSGCGGANEVTGVYDQRYLHGEGVKGEPPMTSSCCWDWNQRCG